MKVDFNVNGRDYTLDVEADKRLLDILRDDLNLTGVKEGCSIGECGACTVIMEGKAVASCLVLAPQIRGRKIITVEGLEENGELDMIQKAFKANNAVQCGFCTAGMIMTAKSLLMKNKNPSRAEIKEAIAGNLCRCTGYKNIVDAVEDVSNNLR